MDSKRTRQWYVTRFALVVTAGLVALVVTAGLVLFIAVVAWSLLTLVHWGPRDTLALGPFQFSWQMVLEIVALAIAVVGLIWLIRIVRGARNEPPPWRYRDR